jgi:hypothetical protein
MSDQLFIDGLPEQAESFAVQLSSNDQRFTATCRDATGRIFVAWHDANLNVVLCEDVGNKLQYIAGPVPGSKNSCVSLLIAENDYVRVYYGGRAVGEISGAFPLRREVYRVPGVRVAAGGDAALAGRVTSLAGRALTGE